MSPLQTCSVLASRALRQGTERRPRTLKKVYDALLAATEADRSTGSPRTSRRGLTQRTESVVKLQQSLSSSIACGLALLPQRGNICVTHTMVCSHLRGGKLSSMRLELLADGERPLRQKCACHQSTHPWQWATINHAIRSRLQLQAQGLSRASVPVCPSHAPKEASTRQDIS